MRGLFQAANPDRTRAAGAIASDGKSVPDFHLSPLHWK